jgi:hypothetical protein
VIAATPSWANSVRVPDTYYGVNYARFNKDPDVVRASVLNALKAGGFTQIRFTIPWTDVEPVEPSGGVHNYTFTWPDVLVRELAERGLTGQPTMWKTPGWNVPSGLPNLGCLHVDSRTPEDLQAYGLAAGAVVARYGPGGSFWAENPGLPYRPFKEFEIWNEPNLKGFWCPEPQPARYATMAAFAANRIHAVDPSMKIITGGIPLGSGSGLLMKPGEFMEKMLNEVPNLPNLVDSIGIHVYPFGDMDKQLKPLKYFRKVFRAAGLPDSVPMTANEFGWSTEGRNPITEPDRVERYKTVPAQVPATNCNVDGVVAHAWTTAEANINDNQDFFGIANPVTGHPYHSGLAYQKTVATMLGKGKREAPHAFVKACPGMPQPNHDGDGHTDAHDYFPYDPTQWEGPPGWDSPDSVGHLHARKSCRRWYRWSAKWVHGDHSVHQAILAACVTRYLELKKSGELGPLRQASRASCRATAPPPSHWQGHHGVKRRRIAVNRCTFQLIRRGFHLHVHLPH